MRSGTIIKLRSVIMVLELRKNMPKDIQSVCSFAWEVSVSGYRYRPCHFAGKIVEVHDGIIYAEGQEE